MYIHINIYLYIYIYTHTHTYIYDWIYKKRPPNAGTVILTYLLAWGPLRGKKGQAKIFSDFH